MDVREERGKAIAALGIVKKADKGGIWTVPAQSRAGFYKVDLTGENPKCTCPDFELRGKACKHVFAVAIPLSSSKTPMVPRLLLKP